MGRKNAKRMQLGGMQVIVLLAREIGPTVPAPVQQQYRYSTATISGAFSGRREPAFDAIE
jgi:hypothetical protein